MGQDSNRQLEDALMAVLADDSAAADAQAWVEVAGAGASRRVRLAGCTTTRQNRDQVERVLRSALVRSAAAAAAVRNDIAVDPLR